MDTAVRLDSELVKALEQVTAQEGVTVERVIEDLAREYLRKVREVRIKEEFDRYQAAHAEIKKEFLGRHIAFYQGEVIDHDDDPMMLVQRIRARLGDAPVLITQVQETAMPVYMIRSPRLVQES